MFDDRQTAGSKEPVDGPRLVRDDFSVNRVEQRDADISPWTYSPDIFPSRTIFPSLLHSAGHCPLHHQQLACTKLIEVDLDRLESGVRISASFSIFDLKAEGHVLRGEGNCPERGRGTVWVKDIRGGNVQGKVLQSEQARQIGPFAAYVQH